MVRAVADLATLLPPNGMPRARPLLDSLVRERLRHLGIANVTPGSAARQHNDMLPWALQSLYPFGTHTH